MNADQVRAYVNAKWPGATQSLFAQAVLSFCAADETTRAVEFAQLQSCTSELESKRIRRDALEHATQCIDACDTQGIEYDEETLSHSIETSFSELDLDACDEVAREALKQTRRAR